jgi:hypothetical protein
MTRTGQGGVAGEVWDLRTDVSEAFECLYEDVDDLVTILEDNSIIVQGKVRVNFTGPGVIAQLDNTDPSQVNVSLVGYDGNLSQTYVSPISTVNMPYGHFGYVAGQNRAELTDARFRQASFAAGAYNGIPNALMRQGMLETLVFSHASPIPNPGDPIFLARADDEPNDAAAGKSTALAPTNCYLCPVGQVVAVNAAQFLSARTAKCIVHIFPRILRAP